MLIIGLTGSIGMGKSTAATRFRQRGIAVSDADREVHKLYEGEAVAAIDQAFPGVVKDGKVDRQELAKILLADATGYARLEAVVHPLVWAAQREFLRREARRGAAMAVLEIPLLFETNAQKSVDVIVVVRAHASIQRARVLARPGMTPERLAQIESRQLPDEDKCSGADFVVDTSGLIEETEHQIDTIIESLSKRRGTAYARIWAL
jgi:dephospho-CoA kinase